MKLVLAGGSGQVGNMIRRYGARQGWEIVTLTRHVRGENEMYWDGQTIGAWAAHIDGADVVINLAGRSVNCRYTRENRRQMMESRIVSTSLLGEVMHQCTRVPALWLQASTATIYDHALERANDEHTGMICSRHAGKLQRWDFSVQIAEAWEKAAVASCPPRTRLVCLRTAMVMSPDTGGVFHTLLTLCRRFLGGASGSGKQYVSWIHETDFVRAIHFLIENGDLQGPVNICSPYPLKNTDFMREIRKAIGVPWGFPAAPWMLEIGAFLMRTETELLLKSRCVVPARLQASGFSFSYAQWADAVRELVSRNR
jgi:uncharacterized protein (TIGR01777 family)